MNPLAPTDTGTAQLVMLGMAIGLMLAYWLLFAELVATVRREKVGRTECPNCGKPLGWLRFCKRCDSMLGLLGLILTSGSLWLVGWLVHSVL